MQTPASKMTIEHLGRAADEADLATFRTLVRDLMNRDGLSEQAATDALWGNGGMPLLTIEPHWWENAKSLGLA